VISDTQVFDVLKGYVGTIVARSIMQTSASAHGVDLNHLNDSDLIHILPTLENGIRAFNNDPAQVDQCLSELRSIVESFDERIYANSGVSDSVRVDIRDEYDVVKVRGQAMTMCDQLGFGSSEKVKITTVASELARNIVQYVGTGYIDFRRVSSGRPGIEIHAVDQGAGIPDFDTIMAGGYVSKTGMGMGLIGARRLMDDFDVKTSPEQGTEITVRKYVTC
jgi:serine/threonine-protein kinase RsbT